MSSRVALLLLVALPAGAQTVDITATTLLAGRQDPRDGKVYTVVPAWQNLHLVAQGLTLPGVDDGRIVVSGWGAQVFGDPRAERVAADLDVGYLEGKLFWRRLEVRLGRQFVHGGAARATHVDGASLTLRLWRGLGLTAYGGMPVVPRFGVRRGDAVVGGRLFWRWSVNGEAGASFLQMNDVGRIARQDLGVDLRFAPHRTLTVSGYALLSLYEKRLAEADARVSWQPVRALDLGVDYRRTAPDLFLPRSSLFSVFSEEKRDEAGGYLYARPVPRIALSGDYHFISNADGFGHRGGARGTLTVGPRWNGTLGVDARALHLPRNGYVQGRLFATWRVVDAFTATVDADFYWYEKALQGQRYSFTGAATVGWEFAPGWRAVVAGVGDVTPQVEQRFEVLAKLVFNHTLRVHAEVKP